MLAELKLQTAGCPGSTMVDGDGEAGLFLTAEAGKELVDNMNNCHHTGTSYAEYRKRL
jgi:hypothetical protein